VIKQTKQPMLFNMKAPCDDCPFRSDHPIPLNPGRIEGIVESIMMKDAPFPCHKTTHGSQKTPSHCAGALIFQKKNSFWSLAARIAMIAGWFKPDRLDMRAPVCASVAELSDAQRRTPNSMYVKKS
jgi:hypothetical protein